MWRPRQCSTGDFSIETSPNETTSGTDGRDLVPSPRQTGSSTTQARPDCWRPRCLGSVRFNILATRVPDFATKMPTACSPAASPPTSRSLAVLGDPTPRETLHQDCGTSRSGRRSSRNQRRLHDHTKPPPLARCVFSPTGQACVVIKQSDLRADTRPKDEGPHPYLTGFLRGGRYWRGCGRPSGTVTRRTDLLAHGRRRVETSASLPNDQPRRRRPNHMFGQGGKATLDSERTRPGAPPADGVIRPESKPRSLLPVCAARGGALTRRYPLQCRHKPLAMRHESLEHGRARDTRPAPVTMRGSEMGAERGGFPRSLLTPTLYPRSRRALKTCAGGPGFRRVTQRPVGSRMDAPGQSPTLTWTRSRRRARGSGRTSAPRHAPPGNVSRPAARPVERRGAPVACGGA